MAIKVKKTSKKDSVEKTQKESTSSRLDPLEEAMAIVEKQFGKGALFRFDRNLNEKIETIPTGCIGLDLALGIGGVPKGRVIEVYGPESSGKTTLTLHIAAECQKQGGTVAFIDSEHALDINRAAKLGINVKDLLISQPDSGEQALGIADELVRSKKVDLIIIDSVAALTPKAEIDGDMGDSHMGLHARLMSQGLRKIVGSIAKKNCTVIFINQLREKIGVMFGSPEVTTGGKALKFYSSVRLDIRRIATLNNNGVAVGNKVKVKVVKNKVAAPFKEVQFDLMFEDGISTIGSLFDVAVEQGIIDKAGAWYSYNGTQIGQGRENSKKFLSCNQDVALEIKDKILNQDAVLEIGEIEEVPVTLEDDSLIAPKEQMDTQERVDGQSGEASQDEENKKPVDTAFSLV